MTPDDLEELVLNGPNDEAVERAFAGMPEKERATLSTTAQSLHNQLHRSKANAKASDRLKRAITRRKGEAWTHWNLSDTHRSMIALFACGPLTAVKKQSVHIGFDQKDVVERIISDRKPEWLGDWIEHELEAEWTTLEFTHIHKWVKAGLCSKPKADRYYQMLAGHLMRPGHYGREKEYIPPISEQLLADPVLLEDIEGLFRAETNAFNTNEWLTRGAPNHYETWPQALKKLADGGHLDRDNLLDLALKGLKADIKQNQLSGYSKFFKSMDPSGKELTSRQQGFVDLLCHQVGHVQKFAVDMLAKIETLKQLDDRSVLRELPAVFASDAKGNAIAALRLLDKVIKRTNKTGASDPSALDAVTEALRHVHPDVQAKAIGLLSEQTDQLGQAQWDSIADFGDFVAASNTPALFDLLKQSGIESDTLPASADLDAPESYVPVKGDVLSQTVLFDEDRLEPIGSLNELIDTAHHCVEIIDSPDEIERLIDGISRFADERPADFDERVAPMLHRFASGTPSMNGLGSASPGVAEAVKALVMTWASGTLYGSHRGELSYYSQESAFVPVIGHLHAIANRIVKGDARQILSFPTHRGGWIDPLVWIERLSEITARPRLSESIDLHRSMLRLAPDNRPKALEKAKSLSGEVGRIARLALGGDERPSAGESNHYASWVCAARTRDPFRDWRAELEPLGVEESWPGGASPAVFRWTTGHKQHQAGDLRWKAPIFNVETKQPSSTSHKSGGTPSLLKRLGKMARSRTTIPWEKLPTAALNRLAKTKAYWSSDLNTSWVAQYLGTLWLLDPSSANYSAAQALINRIDDDASNWSPVHGFFDTLFVKGRPWAESGHLLLCLGLVGKDADAKGLAVDALIEGIDRRVFEPVVFGKVMGKLLAGEWIKLNRLGAALTQVAQTSPMHAVAISDAMQQLIPGFDFSQRNSHHLLQAFTEAQAVARQPINEAVMDQLKRVPGKGKAAKLAKAILDS